jgi:ribonuclease J
MEGTNIRPKDDVSDHEATLSESEVEAACAETIKSTEGMVLALYSAQNIDRMVTLFRAGKRTGRSFVMTLYGAAIARATGNPNIPKPGREWSQVMVYVPGWQRAKVKQAGAFELVDDIKPFRLYEEDLAKAPERWVLSFSWPMAGVLDKASALAGASAIWSMWPGYLAEPSGVKLQTFLAERSIPMTIHHTSGHASIADLQRLAKALSPARVVPIHSFGAEGFDALFEGVEHHSDGNWWGVE